MNEDNDHADRYGVRVTGRGEVAADPDVFRLHFRLSAEGDTAAGALALLAERRAALAGLFPGGLEAGAVELAEAAGSALPASSRSRLPAASRRKPAKRAVQQCRGHCPDLNTLAAALDGVDAAGAEVLFAAAGLSNEAEAAGEALALAAEEAQAKAEIVAAKMGPGYRLGPPLTVREISGPHGLTLSARPLGDDHPGLFLPCGPVRATASVEAWFGLEQVVWSGHTQVAVLDDVPAPGEGNDPAGGRDDPAPREGTAGRGFGDPDDPGFSQ